MRQSESMPLEREAEIRARVAANKRLQPSQAHGLLAVVDLLRGEVAALRAVIAPQADETGESFALNVRGVMALLMANERARYAALHALAQRVVDAQYPGDMPEPENLGACVAILSGWLADNPEAS